MLATSTQLRHPSGVIIETPLLIPSFSSKGFGIAKRKDGERGAGYVSETGEILAAASEFLTESMLISAYDVHYAHVPLPEHAVTEITFLDSGGYETSDQQDLSATFYQQVIPKEWNEQLYEGVLQRWPEHIPAVFVSYDDARVRYPLADQISRARRLFANYRGQLTTLLIKPETVAQKYVQVENIIALAKELGAFDVIGLTEKELGNSYLLRMQNIARIRYALNDVNISSPLHIFGSLDPVSVPLYFLAGAEIFDGLTWLRYAYDGGVALYRHNYAARRSLLHRTDDFIKLKTMQDNLGSLSDLGNQMRRFLNDGDLGKFGVNQQILEEAVDLLKTRVKRAR
jgi:hypothetical protein